MVLNKSNYAIPESYAFYEKQPRLAILKKMQKRLTLWNYATVGLPKSNEPFSVPYSIHKLHQHPLYQWADIINLHWVAYFLDYPTFFKRNTKQIIWTLHDMVPFSGGNHYEFEFPKKVYHSLIKRYTTSKKQVIINHNLTIVSPSNWLKKQSPI